MTVTMALNDIKGHYFMTPKEIELAYSGVPEAYKCSSDIICAVQDGWKSMIVEDIRRRKGEYITMKDSSVDEETKDVQTKIYLVKFSGNYFLTTQEHKLIGSSPTKEEYKDNMNIPWAVQDGWNSMVVNYIRQKAGTFKATCIYFVDDNGVEAETEEGLLEVKLSLLDLNTGKAISEPRPSDKRMKMKEEYMLSPE